MTQKLTIIVTCTDRKSATIRDGLRVRDLPPASLEERAASWSRRLRDADDALPLRDLYQGETWTQVGVLERAIQRAGYRPETVVASAGVGLRPITYRTPAYGATFSRPHPDAVGITIEQAQGWWRAMNSPETTDNANPTLDGPMIWVLSESYSRVIGSDLLERAETDRLLVFGGSEDIPASLRVPSNRALRQALGGTATSLNLRMAIQWIRLAGRDGLHSPDVRGRWQEWSGAAEHHENWNREPLTDSAVLDFISTLRRVEPDLSKTRALRQLRDAGMACEQRRFGALFTQSGASV